jgi:phosphoglycolate phosphatase
MKYKLVIFDFDGTIADTSPGILDSHRFALSYMKKNIPSDSELRVVIGGHLLDTYIDRFGFPELKAREAVRVYRERYAEVGIHKAELYPEFEEMVKKLYEKGYLIGVATLKAEKFAEIMLKEMGIRKWFNTVCGMDEHDDLDKAGLIKKCCSFCGVSEKDAILVGDSNNDFVGAQEAGVDFIGVTYGFGFQKDQKYDFCTVDSAVDILSYL